MAVWIDAVTDEVLKGGSIFLNEFFHAILLFGPHLFQIFLTQGAIGGAFERKVSVARFFGLLFIRLKNQFFLVGVILEVSQSLTNFIPHFI